MCLSYTYVQPSAGGVPAIYIWDSGLIERTGMGRDAYVAHLEKLISDEHLTATGTPEEWANESLADAQLACVADGAQVDEGYYHKEIRVVDRGWPWRVCALLPS